MSQPFRVIFFGTPDLGVPSLRALHADPRFDVVAVVSQPDKPQGRKQEFLPTPMKAAAIELGIPVHQPEKLTGEALDLLRSFDADYFVLIAYGKLLRQEVLDMPRIAPVNAHVSLLPRWRGASPIQAALLAGDKETGVTYMRMTAGMDEGPMLDVKTLSIPFHATAGEIFDALGQLTAEHFGDVLTSYAKTHHEIPQDETSMTHCSKISKEMGQIDWQNMTAQEIHQRWQAFTPWPGIYTFADGKRIKLLEVLPKEGQLSPGMLQNNLVGTKEGVIELLTIQPEGKRPMPLADFIRGQQLQQFDPVVSEVSE